MVIQCKECGEVLAQTPGKRGREFCDSTCRSNYWQKAKRKLNNPVQKKKPVGVRIDIKNIESETPPMPVRMEGENGLDFAARKNEWKRKYNQ